MEKTIGQLFEIEEKANQIINRASEEKTRLHDEFEREISQMEEAIFAENTKKLKALKEQADIDLANEIEVLISDSELQLKELEAINTRNHDKLVKQVFDNIIHSS